MKRNRLMIPLLLALLAAFIALARTAEKPNIIVILVDDIGVGDFGFTGGMDFPTPNIDRFAREGVTFSHGYAMPSCSPHPQLCWLCNDHKEWRVPGRDTNLARPLLAIREGNFKLVMEGDNVPELYDLIADPGEANNLAAGEPERVAQMKPQVIPDDHPLYGRFKNMAPGSRKPESKKANGSGQRR